MVEWKLFRRKPIDVWAVEFIDGLDPIPGLIILDHLTIHSRREIESKLLPRFGGLNFVRAAIETNNGFIAVCEGDYIIRAEKGALHAAPPEIFHIQYTPQVEYKNEGDRLLTVRPEE